MSKKVILLLSSFICCIQLHAQNKDNTAMPPAAKPPVRALEPEEAIYNTAVKYGDYTEAKHAIYSLMQKHPDNIGYLDSLTRLYFAMSEYPQCILAGTDYMRKDTSNTTVMEVVAISQGALNRNKEALELWDKLWKRSGNAQYAYQVAVNQYLLKRYGECAQMIDIILKDPAADKETVSVSLDQNRSQKVAMKAAAHNLLGVIQKELSLPDQAKANFEAALKLSPDFELPKGNLADMNKGGASKEEAKPKVGEEKIGNLLCPIGNLQFAIGKLL